MHTIQYHLKAVEQLIIRWIPAKQLKQDCMFSLQLGILPIVYTNRALQLYK